MSRCDGQLALNAFRIPEMDAVPAFMSIHPSNLYVSKNELKIEDSITVPKLATMSANKFLRRF